MAKVSLEKDKIKFAGRRRAPKALESLVQLVTPTSNFTRRAG